MPNRSDDDAETADAVENCVGSAADDEFANAGFRASAT